MQQFVGRKHELATLDTLWHRSDAILLIPTIGECKWSPRASDADVLARLAAATAAVVPAQGQWRVYYVGMGGWRPAAHASRATHSASDNNWHASG